MQGPAHRRLTVILTGMWKEAPWHPFADDVAIATPLGMWTTTLVPGVTGMLSPLWVGTVTPELLAVHPIPPTTITVNVGFWEMETIVTG